jgi:hypothetical protein
MLPHQRFQFGGVRVQVPDLPDRGVHFPTSEGGDGRGQESCKMFLVPGMAGFAWNPKTPSLAQEPTEIVIL